MRPAPTIPAVVLAAGTSSRFGAVKQLAPVAGRPLIEYALRAAAGATRVSAVAVTLGANAHEIASHADLGGAEIIDVPAWSEGIAAGLRAAVARYGPEADALVFIPADQPAITADLIDAVVDAWDGSAPAVRAVHDGRPGHPVLIGRTLFGQLASLRGRDGAGPILRDAGTVIVDGGQAAVADVDVPGDVAYVEALIRTFWNGSTATA